MLGKVGEQIDELILIRHTVATAVLNLGQLPAVTIVGEVILVVGRNQSLVQFQDAVSYLMNMFLIYLLIFVLDLQL